MQPSFIKMDNIVATLAYQDQHASPKHGTDRPCPLLALPEELLSLILEKVAYRKASFTSYRWRYKFRLSCQPLGHTGFDILYREIQQQDQFSLPSRLHCHTSKSSLRFIEAVCRVPKSASLITHLNCRGIPRNLPLLNEQHFEEMYEQRQVVKERLYHDRVRNHRDHMFMPCPMPKQCEARGTTSQVMYMEFKAFYLKQCQFQASGLVVARLRNALQALSNLRYLTFEYIREQDSLEAPFELWRWDDDLYIQSMLDQEASIDKSHLSASSGFIDVMQALNTIPCHVDKLSFENVPASFTLKSVKQLECLNTFVRKHDATVEVKYKYDLQSWRLNKIVDHDRSEGGVSDQLLLFNPTSTRPNSSN